MNPGMDTAPQAAPPKLAPPGRRLADARKARNLTSSDIARQLKLSVSQVDALEAGRYQQLPGPIFVRGFIRNYARLVKLDPGELLQEGSENLPQPQPQREARPPSPEIPFPSREAPRWRIYAAVAAVIVGALAIYEFYWNDPVVDAARPGVVASAPESAARQAPAKPVATERAPLKAPQGAQAGSAKAVVAPQGPAPVAAAAPRPGERQVRMNFNDESWVEIRDRSERVIFSQLNRPGTQQSVQGYPPFSVVVGNAHGVRMTYDDKPVDLAPHTKIDVARLILQ